MLPAQASLFEMYFDYVKDTEPPLIFHRWSLISCISASLGQQCWVPFGGSRVFPNQFVMLIGEVGARKSTAIKRARKLLSKSGYSSFAAEKTTKEKFLLDLEGLEDVDDNTLSHNLVMENLLGTDVNANTPKEVFVVADEFNDFMRCGDLEFHSMLGSLWDYDDEATPYKQRLKNSKSISIYQPTVNLLGGNTHTNFSAMFPPQAIGQGFISRLLLIFSEPSGKRIAWPGLPDAAHETAIVAALRKIKLEFTGPIGATAQAKQALEVLYNSYEGFADMRFTGYFARRYTHLLKLCLVCAAVELKREIGIREVIMANTILRYAEHFMPAAMGEFGKAKNSDVATKILALLTKENRIVDIPEIWMQVSSDLDSVVELDKVLQGLSQAGKIKWIPKGGSGIKGYTVLRKSLKSTDNYVDYSLLREYKQVKV